jgi:hypothetical protein
MRIALSEQAQCGFTAPFSPRSPTRYHSQMPWRWNQSRPPPGGSQDSDESIHASVPRTSGWCWFRAYPIRIDVVAPRGGEANHPESWFSRRSRFAVRTHLSIPGGGVGADAGVEDKVGGTVPPADGSNIPGVLTSSWSTEDSPRSGDGEGGPTPAGGEDGDGGRPGVVDGASGGAPLRFCREINRFSS